MKEVDRKKPFPVSESHSEGRRKVSLSKVSKNDVQNGEGTSTASGNKLGRFATRNSFSTILFPTLIYPKVVIAFM